MEADDDENEINEEADVPEVTSEKVDENELPSERKPSKTVSITEPHDVPVSRQPTLSSLTLQEKEPSTQSIKSSNSKKSVTLKSGDQLAVNISDDEKEETCDEVIAAVLENAKIQSVEETKPEKSPSKKNIATKTKKTETKKHEPDCALYEEESSQDDYDDGKPCPPGVRRCCTCGVCPLDAKKRKKTGSESSEDYLLGDKDKYGITSMFSVDSDSLYWDGEGWGRKGEKKKKKKRAIIYDYEMDQLGYLDTFDHGEYAMSDRSRHEGSLIEDYMKFFIEPIDICYKTLSSLTSSYVSCEDTGLQRTIVIIKPPAVPFKETILRVIFEEGFQILGLRVLHLTPEQVSEIFSKYYGSPPFAHLVVSVSNAPVLAICISAMNVIKRWLSLIGPDGSLKAEWFFPLSMRKMFGLHKTQADWIHGSENLRESNKENRYFYPDSIIEPMLDDLDKVTDYCALTMNKSIVEACTELVKKRPADPIIFFADYLLLHNPFQPRLPRVIAMTPT